MTQRILLLLCGVPGSGKTTWIQANCPNAIVCSADDWFSRYGTYQWSANELGRAHHNCMYKAKEAMGAGAPLVVIDNTNIRARDRKPYIEEALACGYLVFMLVLPPPDTNRNVHGVSWEKVQELQAKIPYAPGMYQYLEKEFVPKEMPL